MSLVLPLTRWKDHEQPERFEFSDSEESDDEPSDVEDVPLVIRVIGQKVNFSSCQVSVKNFLTNVLIPKKKRKKKSAADESGPSKKKKKKPMPRIPKLNPRGVKRPPPPPPTPPPRPIKRARTAAPKVSQIPSKPFPKPS